MAEEQNAQGGGGFNWKLIGFALLAYLVITQLVPSLFKGSQPSGPPPGQSVSGKSVNNAQSGVVLVCKVIPVKMPTFPGHVRLYPSHRGS